MPELSSDTLLALLGFHAAALPQFLALVTRLKAAASEPTFEEILRAVKRGVTGDGWRHALLQLEVNRALREPGTSISFEPEISGSTNRADLMITRPDGSSFLVRQPPSPVPKPTSNESNTNTTSGRPSQRSNSGTRLASPCR
jgi:hypothetical protein